MDNKVNFLRGTAAEYEVSTKDNDTFYYTTDDEKLYLGNKEITGGGVTIDGTLSDTSKNPVQNKVINAALNTKANLTDIPTTLPANGGNANTVGNLPASNFLGSSTNFNYHFANGAGSDVISSVKGESHIFAFNFTDTPTAYGYLDVSSFDGEGFAPAPFGLVRQIWTDWANPSERFVRIYKATSETEGTWTDWSRCNADTVDGKHASDFASVRKINTQAEVDGFLESGIYSVENVPTVFGSVNSAYYMLIVNRHRIDANYNVELAIPYIDGRQQGVYYRNCAAGTWGTWTNVADGGNADTVDGIHITTADDGHTYDWLACFTSTNEIRAINPDRAYVKNAGNADTVDNLHASSFMQYYGILGDTSILNDSNYKTNYIADYGNGAELGLPVSGWYHIIYIQHQNNNGYGMQLAFPLNFDGAAFRRMASETTWQAWKNIADGGNAATANFAANLAEAVGNNCLRNISAGTGDLTAGSSPLANGTIYLVYE